jgi:putative tryptophan/tyrosine transport system substrate-binding protein
VQLKPIWRRRKNVQNIYRRTAGFADNILKGKKPADLAVMRPTKTELAINLKTARALGLAVPQALIATANEVIE